MHFTSLVLTSVLATSTIVFAAPTRNGRGTKMMTSSPKTNITGAVYCEFLVAFISSLACY